MIANGDKVEDIELTLKNFQWLEEDFLRETFTEEFALQLPILRGQGDLHNDTLGQLFAKLISKIEKKNQLAIAPLKEFVQTLK